MKLYSLNQPIHCSCFSDNIVNLIDMKAQLVLIIEVTQDFNNLSSLDIIFQCSDNKDFYNPINLIQQTIVKSQLKEQTKSVIKFYPKNQLSFTRLEFKVRGVNPTQGQITAVLEEEENEQND